MRGSAFHSAALAGLLLALAGCGTGSESELSATQVQADESVEPTDSSVVITPDLPTIPVFTVEDLARQSDLVVIASAGRLAEEVRLQPDPNGPERVYAIVELGVEDVLGSKGGFEGDTVAVWLPQSVVPSPDLPNRYVLFLRYAPSDFDAAALEVLAKHPNPTVLVPGFNSIMEISDNMVTAPSEPFYGLGSGDSEPLTGSDGQPYEAPFAITFALDDVRAVVKPAVGLGAAEPVPDELTAADVEWLHQLDDLCRQVLPASQQLRDLLTAAYVEGRLDGAVAIDLFGQASIDRAVLDESAAGISEDVAVAWRAATESMDSSLSLLSAATELTGDELQAKLLEFQESVSAFELAWEKFEVPNCQQFI